MSNETKLLAANGFTPIDPCKVHLIATRGTTVATEGTAIAINERNKKVRITDANGHTLDYPRGNVQGLPESTDLLYPSAAIVLKYKLMDSYLNTEEKRREHLRGIRLESMFHQILLTVRGVEHVYENRIGGWFKLNAKTRAEIASYTGGAK